MNVMRSASSADRAGGSESGFVLITVLWLLVLLAVVASTALSIAALRAKTRAHVVQAAELESLAGGILTLSALQLSDRRADGASSHFPAKGDPFRCTASDATIIVRVIDTAGLLDLNASSIELLQAFIDGVGVPSAEADRIAAAIVDFRDADDLPSVGGAEQAEYQRTGMRHGPKNALFDSVDELDQVFGVSRSLFERLRPLLTVHSRMPGIDPEVAPPEVLRALSRNTANAQSSFVARSPRRTYLITVSAVRRGVRAARESVIELSPRAPHGFVVRATATGPAAAEGTTATGSQMHMPCPGWPRSSDIAK